MLRSSFSCFPFKFLHVLDSIVNDSIFIIGILSLRNESIQMIAMQKYFELIHHNSTSLHLPEFHSDWITNAPSKDASIINLDASTLLQDLSSMPQKYFSDDRQDYIISTWFFSFSSLSLFTFVISFVYRHPTEMWIVSVFIHREASPILLSYNLNLLLLYYFYYFNLYLWIQQLFQGRQTSNAKRYLVFKLTHALD